jgi:hypothetical protein
MSAKMSKGHANEAQMQRKWRRKRDANASQQQACLVLQLGHLLALVVQDGVHGGHLVLNVRQRVLNVLQQHRLHEKLVPVLRSRGARKHPGCECVRERKRARVCAKTSAARAVPCWCRSGGTCGWRPAS